MFMKEGSVEWVDPPHSTAPSATTIPIKIFMAGDILFYAIALGTEGFATWWCNWCKLFNPEWQAVVHQVGVPWTMDALQEHATQIENGPVNLNSVHVVCGGKEQPLFDAIDTDHFIPPVLHLSIGKGNNILKNMTTELQAAVEKPTLLTTTRERRTQKKHY
jgi:hypothetical protein